MRSSPAELQQEALSAAQQKPAMHRQSHIWLGMMTSSRIIVVGAKLVKNPLLTAKQLSCPSKASNMRLRSQFAPMSKLALKLKILVF